MYTQAKVEIKGDALVARGRRGRRDCWAEMVGVGPTRQLGILRTSELIRVRSQPLVLDRPPVKIRSICTCQHQTLHLIVALLTTNAWKASLERDAFQNTSLRT